MPDEGVRFERTEVLAETEKGEPNMGALLIDLEGERVWVPKSQIHEDSEVYSKETTGGTLVVKSWWAEQKGLV